MIIWLASYPRSGNTLLRIMLKRVFDYPSYNFDKRNSGKIYSGPNSNPLFRKLIRGLEKKSSAGKQPSWLQILKDAAESDSPVFLKTHYKTTTDNSPVIHIVRDGRNTMLSYQRFHSHYIPESGRTLLDIILGNDYYGDWSTHYRAWQQSGQRRLLLHYEELVLQPDRSIEKLVEFIGVNSEYKPWQNPFKQFQQQEPNFFRQGNVMWEPSDDWTDWLDAVFMVCHGALMEELGYISEAERTAQMDTLNSEQRSLIESTFAAQNDTNYPDQVNSLYETSMHIQSQELVPGWKQLWRKLYRTWRMLYETSMHIQSQELVPGWCKVLHLGSCSIRQLRYHLRRLFGPRIGLLVHYKPRSLQLKKYHLRKSLTTQSCPHISIITPSYQQGKFIERTINSILNQDYPNLEYIVQDGGSTDETTTILRNHNEQLSSWQSQSDNGQAHAINLGFKRTSGDIMMWLNSDDLLMPGALHYVAEYFDCHPEVDVVYSHRILIDEQDNDIGRWILPRHNNEVLSWADFIPQETLFWRREIWNRIGGHLDESYKFAVDWDLLIRFREAGAVFKRLPCFLGAFRVHENQKTSLVLDELGADEMKRIRKRCLGKEVRQHEIRKNITNYLLQHYAYHLLYRISNSLNKPIY